MKTTHPVDWTVVLAAVGLVVGCASGPTNDQLRANPYSVFSMAEAVSAAGEQGDLELRFNPANCECPPWEAKISERWIRTLLTATSDEGMRQLSLMEANVRRVGSGPNRGQTVFEVSASIESSLYLSPTLNTPVIGVEILGPRSEDPAPTPDSDAEETSSRWPPATPQT